MPLPLDDAHQMSYTPSRNKSTNSSLSPINQEWMEHVPILEDLSENDVRNYYIPIARIKKIMKALDGVNKSMLISAEVPILFSKACELLVLHITSCAWNKTESNKRRTIHLDDINNVMGEGDVFSFLTENSEATPDILNTSKSQTSGSDTTTPASNFIFNNTSPLPPYLLQSNSIINTHSSGHLNDSTNQLDIRDSNFFPQYYNEFFPQNANSQFMFDTNSSLNSKSPPSHMRAPSITKGKPATMNPIDHNQQQQQFQYSQAISHPASTITNSTNSRTLSTTNPLNNSYLNTNSSMQTINNIGSLGAYAMPSFNQTNVSTTHPDMVSNVPYNSTYLPQMSLPVYYSSTYLGRPTEYLPDEPQSSYNSQMTLDPSYNSAYQQYNYSRPHNNNSQGLAFSPHLPNNLNNTYLKHMYTQASHSKQPYANQYVPNMTQENMHYSTPMKVPPPHHCFAVTYNTNTGGSGSLHSSENESLNDNYIKKSKRG